MTDRKGLREQIEIARSNQPGAQELEYQLPKDFDPEYDRQLLAALEYRCAAQAHSDAQLPMWKTLAAWITALFEKRK